MGSNFIVLQSCCHCERGTENKYKYAIFKIKKTWRYLLTSLIKIENNNNNVSYDYYIFSCYMNSYSLLIKNVFLAWSKIPIKDILKRKYLAS